MNQRPDSLAVIGLLILAGVLGVGGIVLTALGHSAPTEVWAIVAASAGAVGGWVGKTLTSEPPPLPDAYSSDLTRTGQ